MPGGFRFAALGLVGVGGGWEEGGGEEWGGGEWGGGKWVVLMGVDGGGVLGFVGLSSPFLTAFGSFLLSFQTTIESVLKTRPAPSFYHFRFDRVLQ